MSSTTTTESSLIQQAMNRPLEERLAVKSVRLKQATEAVLVSDAADGLAENRRSTKEYNKQSDRATKAMVDGWVKGNGGSAMPQEDETVVDLGDRYTEVHNHNAPAATTSTVGSIAGKVLPWVLATALGPLGAVLGAWWMGKSGDEVNVKDVQSKFKVEVYDESGKLIQTLPYDQLPKQ